MGIKSYLPNLPKRVEKKPTPKPTHYQKTLWCPNCEEKNDLKIPMGVTIKDFLSTYKCDSCGCNWLK